MGELGRIRARVTAFNCFIGLCDRLVMGVLAWGISLQPWRNRHYFLVDFLHADESHIGLAIIGGVIFNIANLLLGVAAIEIAGSAHKAFSRSHRHCAGGRRGQQVILISPKGMRFTVRGHCAWCWPQLVFDAIAVSRNGTYEAGDEPARYGDQRDSASLWASIPSLAKAMAGSDAPGPMLSWPFSC